jgi:hypothetical protein
MDRGFWFGVLCASAPLVCVGPLHVLCLQCVWSTVCVYMDWFTFLVISFGQVPTLLMCSWSFPFPFPWFSGGCVFSSCWLRVDVALRYRELSPCVLIDFPGLGAVGFVCSGRRLCLGVAFTSGGGECLHTTLTIMYLSDVASLPSQR